MYRLFDFPFILFAYSATSHKLSSDGNHEATIFQRLEDRSVCPGLNKRTEFTDFCDDKLNKFAKMTMNRSKIWPRLRNLSICLRNMSKFASWILSESCFFCFKNTQNYCDIHIYKLTDDFHEVAKRLMCTLYCGFWI